MGNVEPSWLQTIPSIKDKTAPATHAYKKYPPFNFCTTKLITTNGPIPTISIILIAVACNKLIFRERFASLMNHTK